MAGQVDDRILLGQCVSECFGGEFLVEKSLTGDALGADDAAQFVADSRQGRVVADGAGDSKTGQLPACPGLFDRLTACRGMQAQGVALDQVSLAVVR